MAFSTSKSGGMTIMGNSAEECATALTEAGASAVGANCGNIDPFQMSEVISEIKDSTTLPVLAMPNAGRPKFVNNRTVFDMPPSEYLKGIKECVKSGAKIIGGCCGTTPEHIKVLAEAFSGNKD
jgi:5-methyltetrahydrofolate--homocysteine methyltransferase